MNDEQAKFLAVVRNVIAGSGELVVPAPHDAESAGRIARDSAR